MINQCNKCEFRAFSEKALLLHIAEAHPEQIKTTPKTPNGSVDTKSLVQPMAQPNKPEKSLPRNVEKGAKDEHFILNFYNDLKTKQVAFEMVTGKTITGKLRGWNNYEFQIAVNGKNVVLMKHSVVSMQEA